MIAPSVVGGWHVYLFFGFPTPLWDTTLEQPYGQDLEELCTSMNIWKNRIFCYPKIFFSEFLEEHSTHPFIEVLLCYELNCL